MAWSISSNARARDGAAQKDLVAEIMAVGIEHGQARAAIIGPALVLLHLGRLAGAD